MSRTRQGALILAFGIALLSIIFLARREGRPSGPRRITGPSALSPTNSAIPAPGSKGTALAPKPDDAEDDPPEMVRVRRLDGTFEMAEASVSSKWFDDAQALFEG